MAPKPLASKPLASKTKGSSAAGKGMTVASPCQAVPVKAEPGTAASPAATTGAPPAASTGAPSSSKGGRPFTGMPRACQKDWQGRMRSGAFRSNYEALSLEEQIAYKLSWQLNWEKTHMSAVETHSVRGTEKATGGDGWFTKAQIADLEKKPLGDAGLEALVMGLNRRKSRHAHMVGDDEYDEFQYQVNDLTSKEVEQSKELQTIAHTELEEDDYSTMTHNLSILGPPTRGMLAPGPAAGRDKPQGSDPQKPKPKALAGPEAGLVKMLAQAHTSLKAGRALLADKKEVLASKDYLKAMFASFEQAYTAFKHKLGELEEALEKKLSPKQISFWETELPKHRSSFENGVFKDLKLASASKKRKAEALAEAPEPATEQAQT